MNDVMKPEEMLEKFEERSKPQEPIKAAEKTDIDADREKLLKSIYEGRLKKERNIPRRKSLSQHKEEADKEFAYIKDKRVRDSIAEKRWSEEMTSEGEKWSNLNYLPLSGRASKDMQDVAEYIYNTNPNLWQGYKETEAVQMAREMKDKLKDDVKFQEWLKDKIR